MANPFVGEIRLFAGNFAPQGWMTCDGQLLPISQFETLFNLIGTTYGGDGQQTFGLPNLAARVPIHVGSGGASNYQMGQSGGASAVTLSAAQMAIHTHPASGTVAAANAGAGPSGNRLATASINLYGNEPPTVPMATQGVSATGGSQPHDNMAPYLAVTYIISLFGIFPSQN